MRITLWTRIRAHPVAGVACLVIAMSLLCITVFRNSVLGWYYEHRIASVSEYSPKELDDLRDEMTRVGMFSDRRFARAIRRAAGASDEPRFRLNVLRILLRAPEIDRMGLLTSYLCDESASVRREAIRNLPSPLTPSLAYAVLWGYDPSSLALTVDVLIQLNKMPDGVRWIARLLAAYRIEDPNIRAVFAATLSMRGCSCAYEGNSPGQEKQWTDIVAWLRTQTPEADWTIR